MGIINEVKSGADLTHPKASITYVLSAIVAMAVLGIAYWMYTKAKTSVTSAPTVKATTTSTGGVMSGIFGNGT